MAALPSAGARPSVASHAGTVLCGRTSRPQLRSLQSGVSLKQHAQTPLSSHTPAQRVQGRARVGRTQAVAEAGVGTDTYDYIIVGGGTAGCVLANRLSADPETRVLVLEAGADNKDVLVRAPAGIARLFKHPTLDWGLDSLRQEPAANRSIYLARGKLLGGSSSTNATLYHRGAAADYDSWGLDGWSAKDVLPWFVSAESNEDMESGPYHGKTGAMHVETPRYDNELFKYFFEASQQAGLQPNPDFNDWSRPQEGYGTFQVSQKRGRRADAYQMYLKDALNRPNLTVLTGARTCKVHTEMGPDGQPRATGVQYYYGGGLRDASTSRKGEVLLCSGAVHTPQVLMLSGIGPASHLKDHGIDVVADLPGVGKNVQDHPACLSAYTIKDDMGAISITDHIYHASGRMRTRSIANFVLRGRGALTSTGCDRGAFVKSTPDVAQPDLQLRFTPGCALDPDGVGSYVKYGELRKQGVKWPSGITFQIIACRPESRGSISLKSNNPMDAPAIDIGYLNDAEGKDIKRLKAGLKLTRHIAEQPALRDIIKDEMHPGVDCSNEDDMESYIRRTLHSANAIVGSCRMGVEGDKDAVVTRDLRVRGVNNLRVIDASVMPRIPGGQTGAPVVMVAERAAAMMLGQESLDRNSAAAGAATPLAA